MAPNGPGAEAEDRPPATPNAAAAAFLAALTKKDAEALAKSVSFKAPNELVIRTHKKTLSSILARSLKPADLDKMAQEFEGFDVLGGPSSNGSDKATVMLANGTVRRKLYLRLDSNVWKVLDYGGKVETEPKAKSSRGR
jgi:hypothetical protein